MNLVTLNEAIALSHCAFAIGLELGSPPLAVAVLDARGSVKLLHAQDGVASALPFVVIGKANAAISYQADGVDLEKVVAELPHCAAGFAQAAGLFVPLPGSVLLQREGQMVGAIAVAGDVAIRDDQIARTAIHRVWSSKLSEGQTS